MNTQTLNIELWRYILYLETSDNLTPSELRHRDFWRQTKERARLGIAYGQQTASGNAPKFIEDHERTEDARTEARLDAVYDREEKQEAE